MPYAATQNYAGPPKFPHMGMNPIMIVGCPRSGTTLLSVMLDRHTDVAVTPETAFYDEVAPALAGLGTDGLYSLLRGWRRLGELGLTVDEVLAACGSVPTRARLFATVLDLYARRCGKPCCGEKTPQHLPHVPDILSDFPGSRVLCVVRDGRDVVLSLRAMPWWADERDEGVSMWLRAEAHCTAFEAAYPDRFISVRYEDLIGKPAATMGFVMDFLGLAFQAAQLDPGMPSGVVLDRSRAWKGEALKGLDPCGVGRRQRDADRVELEAIERALAPGLKRRGYLPTASQHYP